MKVTGKEEFYPVFFIFHDLQVANLWIKPQSLPQVFLSASIRQILMTGEMRGMQYVTEVSDAANRLVFVTFFILASSLIVFLLSPQWPSVRWNRCLNQSLTF